MSESSVSESGEASEEILVEHSMFPRNTSEMKGAISGESRVENPSCGDRLVLKLSVADNIIEGIQIVPSGCAVSTAAASLVSGHMMGKSLDDIPEVLEEYSKGLLASKIPNDLGELVHLESLGKFPARHRCATLIVEAFRELLKQPDSSGELN